MITTPLLTVDIVIRLMDQDDKIVVIERRNDPQGWALPGGFVDIGETTREAAIREAKEETGLDLVNVRFLGVYDNPNRDPRGHAVSVAYTASASGEPVAADDAVNVRTVNPKDPGDLCFDHNNIVSDSL
jgi:8-oxo-dGTP diphosphatase